jgi:uncharacterized protein (DUF1499 family)
MTAAIVIGVVIVLAAAGFAVVALQIDDWGRDLTTNVAETTREAADSLMQPIRSKRLASDVARDVGRAAGMLRGWTFVGDAETATGLELRFERRTKWFRFTDDIRVTIEDRGVDRLVHMQSASRIGGADLGQNPRNIRELSRALRELIKDASPVSY